MRSRFLARWVALTAACLSLVGSAAPAWEPPRPSAPVAAIVVGGGASVRPLQAVTAARSAPKPRLAHARAGAPAPRPVPRASGALYVLHRALLR